MTTLTDRPDTGRSDGPSGSAHDSRPLVLVVDDEESYRQALASGLSREGFAVEVAGTATRPSACSTESIPTSCCST